MTSRLAIQWYEQVDTGAISGVSPLNYGGATDWLKYWSENTKGGVALTEFDLNLRTAPGLNLATEVAEITANDLPLLTQDNATTQPTFYPGTDTDKDVDGDFPAFTWNGFTWVQTYS